MKLFTILIFFPWIILGQDIQQASVKMTSEYGSDIQELQDVLSFQEIDYYNVQFAGSILKGKNYQLISKEIWNGEITAVDTLINTAIDDMLFAIQSDTLTFRVIGKKTKSNELKVDFRVPQILNTSKFKATDSENYYLSDIGSNIDISIGKKFYAFVFMLPYDNDGWLKYCEVDESGIDVESWGEKFDLEHYIIFEMLFE